MSAWREVSAHSWELLTGGSFLQAKGTKPMAPSPVVGSAGSSVRTPKRLGFEWRFDTYTIDVGCGPAGSVECSGGKNANGDAVECGQCVISVCRRGLRRLLLASANVGTRGPPGLSREVGNTSEDPGK